MPRELQEWFMSIGKNLKSGSDFFGRVKVSGKLNTYIDGQFQFREMNRHISWLKARLDSKTVRLIRDRAVLLQRRYSGDRRTWSTA